VWNVSGSNPSHVKSTTENLTPVVSLVNVHHLRARAGLVSQVSLQSNLVGYHVNMQHGFFGVLVPQNHLESPPVTADLTTTVSHSYKSLKTTLKPAHSLKVSLSHFMIIPQYLLNKNFFCVVFFFFFFFLP